MRLTSYAVCAALTLYNLSSGTEALAVPVSEEPLEALPENHGRRAALREQMLGPAPAKRASAPIDIMSNTTVVDDPQTLGDDDVGPPPDPSLPDSVSNPDIGSLPDALDFYSDPSSTVGSPLGSIPEIPEKTWGTSANPYCFLQFHVHILSIDPHVYQSLFRRRVWI